jgi:hypothetical protein
VSNAFFLSFFKSTDLPYVWLLTVPLSWIVMQVYNYLLPRLGVKKVCFLVCFLIISFSLLSCFFAIGSNFFTLLILNNEPIKPKNPISRIKKGIWKKHLFEHRKGNKIIVQSYLSNPFEITKTENQDVFDYRIIKKHFRTSHLVAGIFELLVVCIVVTLGLFRDSPFFRIPAAASIFISFTMLLMIASAFHTWLKAWSLPVFILLFVLLNWLSGYEFFGKRNQAFGLNYKTNAAVIPESMLFDNQLVNQIDEDSRKGLAILEKWKMQSSNIENAKPTLVFLNVSGGGLKSALWTVEAMQAADKATEGRLLRNTHLITGSSGGMIGAAFMRELYLRKKTGLITNIYDSNLVNVGFLVTSKIYFKTRNFTQGFEVKAPTS